MGASPDFQMSSVGSGVYVMKREVPEARLELCSRVLVVLGVFLGCAD